MSFDSNDVAMVTMFKVCDAKAQINILNTDKLRES